MTRVLRHLGALAGYGLLFAVYSAPLAARFTTSFVGRESDAQYTTWFFWHFHQSVSVWKTNPLWTDLLYWPYGANVLLQHGWYYFLAAWPLVPRLNLATIYNLFQTHNFLLSAYGTFLVARRWGASWPIAFFAGAVYAFAPDATYKLREGTFDHLCRQVVPFFFWALTRAVDTRRLGDAVLVALALAWAWGSDYYLFLICAVFVPLAYLWFERPLLVGLERRARGGTLETAKRVLEAAMALAALGVLVRLGQGQVEFHGRGSARELLAYVAPYAAFWAAAGLRLLAEYRPTLRLQLQALRFSAAAPYIGSLACFAAMSYPMLWAVTSIMVSGNYPHPAGPWRGGGNPTDVGLFFRPSYFHPLWGGWVRGVFGSSPPAVEHLGFLPGVAAFLLWRRKPRDRWVRAWLAGLAASLAVCLGPWLKILGVHTYLPMPFYFLHLLPVFSQLQTAHHLVPFPVFFLALCSSAFLSALCARLGARKRAWAIAGAFAAVGFEFAHGGMPTHAPPVPALYARLGARPAGALLPVPLGAIFNGLGVGALGAPPLNIYLQTVFNKPIVGGWIARIPRQVYENMRDDALLRDLFAAQEGRGVSARLRDPRFVKRWLAQQHLRYVTVDVSKTPPDLRRAIEKWPLKKIDGDADASLVLYEVLDIIRP
ncbi:MAG TPA: hypothetical protein VNI01_14545 [Elusimicrobiota bacterium]|nr:hypothetical protein [Elusimicrobiota bacterium]